MKVTSTDLSLRRGRYFSKGNGGMACFKICCHSAASRRIGSKLACSSHRRSDTESTYSSSDTDYHSYSSTYSSYSSGYDSSTSTDTEGDLDTSMTDFESSYNYLADTLGSWSTFPDESSSSVSHTEGETNTSTDEGSYFIAAAKGDSYTSACESSDTLSDGDYDTHSSPDEILDSLSDTVFSYNKSTYEKPTEGSTGTERDALTVQKSSYRADSQSSTVDFYYTDTGKSTIKASSERSSSHSRFRTDFQSSTMDSYYTDTSKSTKSNSSENSSSDTTSFSTGDYYSGEYDNRTERFKRYSSGRKSGSRNNYSPTTTLMSNYSPSTFRRQYFAKRRTSSCACAGDQNKKRPWFDS